VNHTPITPLKQGVKSINKGSPMNTQDLFSAYEHAARVAAAHQTPEALAAFVRLERAVDEHNAQTDALARARALVNA